MSRSIGRKASAASVAVMALALGGCQVLGIGGPRMARAPADADPALLANFGSELGNEALADLRGLDLTQHFPRNDPFNFRQIV